MLRDIWNKTRYTRLFLSQATGGPTVGQAKPALLPLEEVLEALGMDRLPAAGTEEKISLPTVIKQNMSELRIVLTNDCNLYITYGRPHMPQIYDDSKRKIHLQGRVVEGSRLELAGIDWVVYPGSRKNPTVEDARIFLDSVQKSRQGYPVGSDANSGWRFHTPESIAPLPVMP